MRKETMYLITPEDLAKKLGIKGEVISVMGTYKYPSGTEMKEFKVAVREETS